VSLCENCGEREAVVHLTQIVDNTITTLNLCEPCAAAKGVETGGHAAKFPLGDFLASLGEGPGAAGAGTESGGACPSCGATLRDFRQTGRLGCAECYRAFEPHLRELLRRVHGSAQHVGERYRGAGTDAAAAPAEDRRTAADALPELRERLRRAVEAEDFEQAARLRDAIRAVE
jgi:protein arginine kinase activator